MGTQVMLIDDHARCRCTMTSLLEREADLEVVAEAGSLAEARSRASHLQVDVAVLDLGLPDGAGLDLIGELHQANPDVAVLILSASLDPENLAQAKEAGADGVLDKLATRGKIVGTIRRLGEG